MDDKQAEKRIILRNFDPHKEQTSFFDLLICYQTVEMTFLISMIVLSVIFNFLLSYVNRL